MYTHPSPLDTKEKYLVEIALNGAFNASTEKSVFGDGTNTNIKFIDVRTLPVNSITQGVIQCHIVTVKGRIEVAKYNFTQLAERLAHPEVEPQYETVDFDVPSDPKRKGKMVMKVIYVKNEGEPDIAAPQKA